MVPADRLTNPTDKIINKGSTKVNTYAKKQNNLTSQILDCGTDYNGFKPMKKSKKDTDNPKEQDDNRKTDHLYSDLFGQSGKGGRRSPVKKRAEELLEGTKLAKTQIQKDYSNYNSKSCKYGNLKSALDTHDYSAQLSKPAPEVDNRPKVNIQGKQTKATKVKELASSILGNEFLNGYENQKKADVLDLKISGLPGNSNIDDLKKAVGAKHIISTTIEVDSIKNTCTGNGRVQIRVQDGEDLDKIKMNLVKKGLSL